MNNVNIKLPFILIGYTLSIFFNTFGKILLGIRNAVNTGKCSYGLKKVGVGILFQSPTDCILNKEYISIGNYSSIGKRAVITFYPPPYTTTQTNSSLNDRAISGIVIGNNVTIGDDCHITATNIIIIGDNCLFGKKVTITDNSHGMFSKEELLLPPILRDVTSKGAVIIEENVWVGDKVTICSNVKVGRGAIVGANSVVTKDVPPFSMVAGVPAKIIKRII